MIPLAVLAAGFILFFLLGRAGVHYFSDYHYALRAALALMFLLTASAHWGAKRADLIRMVPASFKHPELWVTVTGVLEILSALGLLLPSTAAFAAAGLALLLIVVFPANIRASREHLTIGGRPVPELGPRIVIQIIFLVCVLVAGFNLGA